MVVLLNTHAYIKKTKQKELLFCGVENFEGKKIAWTSVPAWESRSCCAWVQRSSSLSSFRESRSTMMRCRWRSTLQMPLALAIDPSYSLPWVAPLSPCSPARVSPPASSTQRTGCPLASFHPTTSRGALGPDGEHAATTIIKSSFPSRKNKWPKCCLNLKWSCDRCQTPSAKPSNADPTIALFYLPLVRLQLRPGGVGLAQFLLQADGVLHVDCIVLLEKLHLPLQVAEVLQLSLVRLHRGLQHHHPVWTVSTWEKETLSMCVLNIKPNYVHLKKKNLYDQSQQRLDPVLHGTLKRLSLLEMIRADNHKC